MGCGWVERGICSVGGVESRKSGFWRRLEETAVWYNRAALGVSGSSVRCRDGFSGVFEVAADQSPSPQKR